MKSIHDEKRMRKLMRLRTSAYSTTVVSGLGT